MVVGRWSWRVGGGGSKAVASRYHMLLELVELVAIIVLPL